jgi:hypothetical protein
VQFPAVLAFIQTAVSGSNYNSDTITIYGKAGIVKSGISLNSGANIRIFTGTIL